MNKAKRDYFFITEEERDIWEQLKKKEIVFRDGKPTPLRISQYYHYPRSVRYYISLFPNHCLDRVDLQSDCSAYQSHINDFINLLDNVTTTERDILNFINQRDAYFIIASILKRGYSFGHHSLYVIPEFQLTINYKADFLIVGETPMVIILYSLSWKIPMVQ